MNKVQVKSRVPQVIKKTRTAVSRAVKDAAKGMVADAKQHAPVDTGYLRSSVSMQMLNDLAAEVIVGADYGVYVELGTRRMAAQPFFFPAFTRTRIAFENKLRKLLS